MRPPTPQTQPTCHSLTKPKSSEHVEPNNKIPSPCSPGTETRPVEVRSTPLCSYYGTIQFRLAIPPQPSYFDQQPNKTAKSRAPANSRSRHNSAPNHLCRAGPAAIPNQQKPGPYLPSGALVLHRTIYIPNWVSILTSYHITRACIVDQARNHFSILIIAFLLLF